MAPPSGRSCLTRGALRGEGASFGRLGPVVGTIGGYIVKKKNGLMRSFHLAGVVFWVRWSYVPSIHLPFFTFGLWGACQVTTICIPSI